MRKLSSMIAIGAVLLLTIISCNQEEIPDQFTIIDGSKDSTDVANQIKELNEQGEFYSFNLKVLDGTEPVSGVTVELTTGENGGVSNATATSDASGNVVFETVVVGGNILTISKDGFFSIIGLIDFKFEEGFNYEIIDNKVVPIKRNESAIVPIFSKTDGTNFATIKGNVTIEKDLTNRSREVADGVTIKANFNNSVLLSSDGISFQEYTLAGNGGIGSGVVDTEGNYEIKVPVAVGGSDISLVIPEVRLDQRLAINGFRDTDNNLNLQFADLPTAFGTSISGNIVPSVNGVKAVFSEPTAEGFGFAINNFSKLGRPIFTTDNASFSSTFLTPSSFTQDRDFMEFLFTSGSNYQSTPDVTVADDEGTGFGASVTLDVAVASVQLSDSGQYFPGGFVSGTIYYVNNGSRNFLASFGVQANDEGKLTQEIIDTEIERLIANRNFPFGSRFSTINSEFDNVEVEFDVSFATDGQQAEGTVNINSFISSLRILNFGSGYVNPVFTFENGDPQTHATISIVDFSTRWEFDLDNSSVDLPYSIEPEISYFGLDRFGNQTSLTEVLDISSGQVEEIQSLIEVDSDGNIVPSNALSRFATMEFTDEAPEFLIRQISHQQAGVSSFSIQGGELTTLFVTNSGRGYTELPLITIMPSIDGLPGTNARIRAIGGRLDDSGEFLWDRQTIIENAGSDYVNFVNQFSSSFSNLNVTGGIQFNLSAGDVVYRDIYFGTGRRLRDVF